MIIILTNVICKYVPTNLSRDIHRLRPPLLRSDTAGAGRSVRTVQVHVETADTSVVGALRDAGQSGHRLHALLEPVGVWKYWNYEKFTAVFGCRAINYPDKVVELLRISSEGIRVALFEGEAPLVLQLPASQRINDG